MEGESAMREEQIDVVLLFYLTLNYIPRALQRQHPRMQHVVFADTLHRYRCPLCGDRFGTTGKNVADHITLKHSMQLYRAYKQNKLIRQRMRKIRAFASLFYKWYFFTLLNGLDLL